MNGRFFGGHQIVAHMWDGFTSYHVSQDVPPQTFDPVLCVMCYVRHVMASEACKLASAGSLVSCAC
jgi:hypothetical protein